MSAHDHNSKIKLEGIFSIIAGDAKAISATEVGELILTLGSKYFYL